MQCRYLKLSYSKDLLKGMLNQPLSSPMPTHCLQISNKDDCNKIDLTQHMYEMITDEFPISNTVATNLRATLC